MKSSPSTAARLCQELPQLGHHPSPDRLDVQGLRPCRRAEGRLQPVSRFNGNTFTPPGESRPVRNEFSNQYGSSVDLIKATADSINTAFVDLTSQMDNGPRKIMKMAQAVGAPRAPAGTTTTASPWDRGGEPTRPGQRVCDLRQ